MSKHGSSDFNSFCSLIKDTVLLFGNLIALENKKIDAIAENNAALLDQHMNEEQAYLMQMRGLDHKREKVQKQLDSSGLTFRQMIEKFESSERETLDTLYGELSSKSSELKDAISTARKYIDLHLSTITALLERLEGTDGIYDKKGEMGQKDPPTRFAPTKA